MSPLIVYNEDEISYYLSSPAGMAGSLDVTSTESGRRMTRHYVECCRESKTPLQDGEDGKRLVEICRAIYESSETGQAITLS